MTSRRFLQAFASTLLLCSVALAQQESVLLNFNGTDAGGRNPTQALIFDSAGNLYGTTSSNGLKGQGTVFEMIPKANGHWKEETLYTFENSRFANIGACLIFDSSGNLYTITGEGGQYHWGTVLELSPPSQSGGFWTATTLHSFNNNGTDGVNPSGCLTFDSAGNLYGATLAGGLYTWGTVFELTPAAEAPWTETILHNFNNNTGDSGFPNGGLIFDASGNLYGTTLGDTANDSGSVFELSPAGGGAWTETILHNFTSNGTDGYYPYGGVVFDSAGNLYGTTATGGLNGNAGTVFELTPSNGSWTENVLHNFDCNGTDGCNPEAGLTIDGSGNLYGTTYGGGIYNGGTVFEMSYNTNVGWQEWLLHSFTLFGPYDGSGPSATVVFDSMGNMYGTTQYGGNSPLQAGYCGEYPGYCGTVYEIKPY
jgi:uncharacterized repeat protein (TIGR03803 family)